MGVSTEKCGVGKVVSKGKRRRRTANANAEKGRRNRKGGRRRGGHIAEERREGEGRSDRILDKEGHGMDRVLDMAGEKIMKEKRTAEGGEGMENKGEEKKREQND